MMEKNVLNTVIYVSSLNSLYSPRYTQKKSTLNINIIYYNHDNYLLELNREIIYGNEKIKLDKKYN